MKRFYQIQNKRSAPAAPDARAVRSMTGILMMKPGLQIFSFALMVLVVNAICLANDLGLEPIEPLRIESHVDSSGYILGEVVEFSILLRNTGADSITLFHPARQFDGYLQWDMKLEFLTPAGVSMLLVPDVRSPLVAEPSVDDFISLSSHEALEIHFVLTPNDLTEEGHERAAGGDKPWILQIPITEQDYHKDSGQLRYELGITGPFWKCECHHGLVLQVPWVVENLFKIPGTYTVTIEYLNLTNWGNYEDPETGIIESMEFDTSWTGHLSGKFTIDVFKRIETQSNPRIQPTANK